MGELACSRFCSMVREYAYSLGERGFFLFGDAATASDEISDRYIGQNTSRQEGPDTVFFGITSLLDFRLAQGAAPRREPIRDVIKGFAGPGTLVDRLEAQRNRALNRGESAATWSLSSIATTSSGSPAGSPGRPPTNR
jgi:hypothetical protein